MYYHNHHVSLLRASKNAETTTPSKTPISVTQSLSALRLTHARLLEEHGVNVALLRRRESDLADAERREADAQATIEGLEGDLRTFIAKLERRERRTFLAEREVGFLQALVVRDLTLSAIIVHLRFFWVGKL